MSNRIFWSTLGAIVLLAALWGAVTWAILTAASAGR